MNRVERGHIEYEVPSADGDPLAEFGDESEEIDAEPSSTYSPLSGARSSIWSRWAATGIICSGFAALAAGALYVNYPTWSARTATAETRGDGFEQPTARPPVEGRTPAAKHLDDTSSISPQKTEHPTATNGQAAPSGTPRNASGSLTGQWSMNTRVESSGLRRYEGLRLEYQVRLKQVGTQVTGDGYKLRENDRTAGNRTPITLIGDVIGDRVVLNFQERGTRRMSGGRLVLDRESENVLRGRFSSDAAKSSGVADAHR